MPKPHHRPNILFAIADDWSFGHSGVHDCPWIKTPAFDRVAREGLLFNKAYTPNAKCAPSRAALLTGRNSWQLKAAANHQCIFPPEFKTYPEQLEDAGYFVGFTAKGWAPGLALHSDGSDRSLTGKDFSSAKLKPATSGISNIDYAANFSDFLDASPSEEPWCFWYGGLEPHRGYEYLSGSKVGRKSIADIDRVPAYWPDNEVVRNDLLDYAFEVEHFDAHLGLMISELEKRDQLDNTLVVVTSDNGMPFPRVKGQGYDLSNHLPLAMRWPVGIQNPGRVINDLVSFIDIAPTFLELAGVDQKNCQMQPITGQSLTDILYSKTADKSAPPRDHVLIGKEKHDVGRPGNVGYPIRGIVTEDFLFLRNFKPDRWPAGNPETGYPNCDGSPTKTEILKTRTDPERKHFWSLAFGKRPPEELYHLTEDPECMVNLADQASYAERKNKLETQLLAHLQTQGDPRVGDDPDIFDRYPIFEEKFADFYEKFTQGHLRAPSWYNTSDVDVSVID